MWVCPAEESAVIEGELRVIKPPGEWIAVGGADCRKGEDGGAMKGRAVEVAGFELSAIPTVLPATAGSGITAAWLILLLDFGEAKHQYRLQQLAHLLFCNHQPTKQSEFPYNLKI